VTQVGSGEFEVVEETLGTLEVLADPKLGAEVPGRVVQVLARTGQRVKQGQLLAVIDAGDVTLANRADEAEVRRLEALADAAGPPARTATVAGGEGLPVEECR
jgi:membrane fusion protein (multidrug efflux system)